MTEKVLHHYKQVGYAWEKESHPDITDLKIDSCLANFG